MKVSTSTVAALFPKMALIGQRIAMVDMVLLVFPALPYLPYGVDGARYELFALKIFFLTLWVVVVVVVVVDITLH